jgi:hypothetical protein
MDSSSIMKTFSQLIEDCRCPTPWDLGNKMLYELCKKNFLHQNNGDIVSKVWLIGRAYSAAVERRKNKEESNEEFYFNRVAPVLKSSSLDQHLRLLKNLALTTESIGPILEAHYHLIKTLNKITKLNKRSFSSKYLHFHLPHLFFIYDSRALSGLRKFGAPRCDSSALIGVNIDKPYSEFFLKCFHIRERIKGESQVVLTPREIDNYLLLMNADKKIKKPKNKH